MRAALGSFKFKLVLYFVLLSLLPIAAAFWGFTSVAGQSETRRVDARLQSGLRSALTAYQEQVDAAQSSALLLARNRTFQIELEKGDVPDLRVLLRDVPDIYVVAAGDAFHVGQPPVLAAQRPVPVYTRVGLVGTVIGYVPFDETLVDELRTRSGLAPSDVLAALHGSTIVASVPDVNGAVPLAPGRTKTIAVSGVRYRTLVAPNVGDSSGIRFAVLSPQSLIDAANATSRDRLLLGLLASLALVSIVAYFEGRSIVRTLGGLAEAAHGIARGRLTERVPVKGRDEFAVLASAFNDMASQLQARLAELEEERARLREANARFGEALAATHDVDQLLQVIVQTAVEATGATGARLSVEGGAVVHSGDTLVAAERLELPLAVGNEPLGSLLLVGASFDDDQKLTATSLASHAAIALDNARLHRIVERQALVDGLTGVANRRRCSEALSMEVARAERHGTPLALVLADLDDFKVVNDEHGHAAGDLVLREFADVLRTTLRESDLAGRWGGEEFLLLLPGTDAAGAAHLADRVRIAFTERPMLAPDGATLAVTCSFGVAQHRPGEDEEELFAAADRALYRAKRLGKNRVETGAPVRSF
ncbi:MAG TPA: diguanylate cyclase [Gaiellaceae bacterium]|nr:diguanylate cyclase [Gaiellaceae bacterium]